MTMNPSGDLNNITVIGPFPPPVHGFAAMTEQLANHLEALGCIVNRCDMAPTSKGFWRHSEQILRCLKSIKEIYRTKKQRGVVAIGCNGGLGQIYTLAHVTTARTLRMECSLHHHSYAYIDKDSNLMKLITLIGSKSTTHVFLSHSMQDAFQKKYSRAQRATVVENAIFVPSQPLIFREKKTTRIGMLSNLSSEKGLYDFISLSEKIKDRRIECNMILAGPCNNSDDRTAIDRAVERGILQYAGPLYNEEKSAFFNSIDLFIFPTHYKNEAQPTVIYEAFSAGVPVIAFDRGCIAEQVGSCLAVIQKHENFTSKAIDICHDYVRSTESEKAEHARAAHSRHLTHATKARNSLNRIFR